MEEEEGGLWLQSCSPIAVAGLRGAYTVCVCVSAGRVCVRGAAGDRDGERERATRVCWLGNEFTPAALFKA